MNEKLKKKRKKKKNEEEKYTLAVTQFFLEFEAFEMTNQQEEIVKKQHIYIELLSFRLKKNSLSLSLITDNVTNRRDIKKIKKIKNRTANRHIWCWWKRSGGWKISSLNFIQCVK